MNRRPHQHVVQYSGGTGSWMAARRVLGRHGPDNVTLLFADVKGTNPSPHAGEDEDLYRFLEDTERDLGVPITRISEGRDIWQLFRDRRFIGNTRVDPCSETLKRELLWNYLKEHFNPMNATVYLGIDWTEAHRFERAQKKRWPWTIKAPLCDPPYLDKDDIRKALADAGIPEPRLYAMGFTHNNCGGFCVKAGLAQHKNLLQVMPDRYAYHEEQERITREHIGKDVTVLRDRSLAGILEHQGLTPADIEPAMAVKTAWWRVRATGELLPRVAPLTMEKYRQRVQCGTDDTDPHDIGGCGCALD